MANTYDLKLDNVGIELVIREGEKPLKPVVHTMDANVTDATLEKGVRAALQLAGDRSPIDIDFEEAHFVPGGAEITVEAGTGRLLRAKATAVLSIKANSTETLAVSIDEIHALGKLPVEGLVSPIIEKVLSKASGEPGIELDPAVERGVLIKPNELLQSQGIDLEFAEPGGWTLDYGPGRMKASYRSS